MSIDTDMVTVFEACYLMKNFDGYADGDHHCIVIQKVKE
jgi:hypothetical protein